MKCYILLLLNYCALNNNNSITAQTEMKNQLMEANCNAVTNINNANKFYGEVILLHILSNLRLQSQLK